MAVTYDKAKTSISAKNRRFVVFATVFSTPPTTIRHELGGAIQNDHRVANLNEIGYTDNPFGLHA